MRVLGIDPGSHKMGYGCIDVDRAQLTYVDAGVLEAKKTTSKYERLTELGIDLEQLFADLNPDAVGLEAGFVKSDNATLVIGGARAIAAFIAGRRGILAREYAPSTVKQVATGRGDADKDLVAALVARQLGMRVVPEPDAGDALAVAICRARDFGPTPKTTPRRSSRTC